MGYIGYFVTICIVWTLAAMALNQPVNRSSLPPITYYVKTANNIFFPLWIGLRVAFPCFIPMHIGYAA